MSKSERAFFTNKGTQAVGLPSELGSGQVSQSLQISLSPPEFLYL